METLISNNSIQNPYKEFEVTIPAFGIVPVFYAFDYIRYLDFGGAGRGDILARIGSSGNESDVVGGGIGYKLTTAVNRVEFRNTTANPITIIIALAIGLINDDRLNFSGQVQTIAPSTTITSYPDITLGTAATLILTANSNRLEAFITNITGDDIRIGDSAITASRGQLLKNNQSIILSTTDAIYGFRTVAGNVTVMETIR